MDIHKIIRLEPVYVVGTHEEFVEAIKEGVLAAMQDNPAGKTAITSISHTHAIAPDGQMHWSAFVIAEALSVGDE